MSEVKVENEEFKLVSNVVPEKELRQAQLRALKLFAYTVGKTYGPMGGYTAYSFRDPNKNTKAIKFPQKQSQVFCNFKKRIRRKEKRRGR